MQRKHVQVKILIWAEVKDFDLGCLCSEMQTKFSIPHHVVHNLRACVPAPGLDG